jgi:outer membrane receptor protein involved in Fe transport/tetratricopeptide (TPR) repeat protein
MIFHRLSIIAFLILIFCCSKQGLQAQGEAMIYFDSARSKLKLNDISGALGDFNIAIIIDPEYAQAYAERGAAKEGANDPDGAMADYNKAIEIDPQCANAYFYRGVHRKNRREYDTSLEDLNCAVTLRPELAIYFFNRGAVQQAMGNLEAALIDYNHAIILEPYSAAYYFARGGARRLQGAIDSAIRDYTLAIGLDPKFAQAYNDRGYARQIYGELGAALEDFNTAIKLNPILADAYLGRGILLRMKRQNDHAIADANTAISINPAIPAAYSLRAKIEQALTDFDNALADCDKVIELDPKNDEAYFERGYTKVLNRDFESAIADFSRSIALNKHTEKPRISLALTLRRLHRDERPAGLAEVWPSTIVLYLGGKLTEAEFFTRCGEGDPKSNREQLCEAYYFAGMVHLLDGNTKAARSLFEKCLETDVSDSYVYNLACGELDELGKNARSSMQNRKAATASAPTPPVVDIPSLHQPVVKADDEKRPKFDSGPAATVTPKTEKLPAYVITTGRYKPQLTLGEQHMIDLFFRLNLHFGWLGTGVGPFVFTPGRVPQGPETVACAVLEADVAKPLEPLKDAHVVVEHLSAPSIVLEDAVNSVLDFGLTGQRGTSIASSQNQGVVLRGIGSDGAGALVLLDGVPLNDPFCGWVEWSAAPREGLDRVEIVPGGGSTAWGNGALGGVVQLFTLPANGKLVEEPGTPNDGGPLDPNLTKQVVRPVSQVSTSIGQYGTRNAEFSSAQPTDVGVVQVLGRVFSTEGFPTLGAGQRGVIDRDGWGRQSMFETRWHQPLGNNLDLLATLRGNRESHGKGTPDQQIRSNGELASVAIASAPFASFAWNGTAYARHRSYADTFTTVDAARSAETPLIDKSAAPATAFGASWTGLWWDPGQGQGRTATGADFSFVRGEVRESLALANGVFNRDLAAGGEQGIFGLFASRDQPLSSTVRATASARLDLWRDADGHRRLNDHQSGASLSNELYGTDSGAELSPSMGLIWRPTGNWRIRANAQESFRRPTLGERYETYGQNSIVTEPNPNLQTEHNLEFEIGAEYRPSDIISLEAAAFLNELRDTLGKLRIARGTNESQLVDALPSGYFVQKRINLDRARVQGLKLSAEWKPVEAFTLNASVLFNETTIVRSGIAPQLAGKQMAQVARRSAILNATWQASAKTKFSFRVRYLDRQFVDDENTLRLGAAVVADLGASYDLTQHVELYLTADNLFDSVIETSRSDDGLVYICSPRLVLVGVRVRW